MMVVYCRSIGWMFLCFVLVDEFLLPEAVGLLFFVACSKVMVRFVTVQTGQLL